MKTVLLTTCIFLLVACQHMEPSTTYVKVYKYDSSIQCGYTGIELDAMALELTKADIDVVCSQKGHDGLMRTTVCGADTGKLNIYTIKKEHLPKAENIGFKFVDKLSEYRDQECKK